MAKLILYSLKTIRSFIGFVHDEDEYVPGVSFSAIAIASLSNITAVCISIPLHNDSMFVKVRKGSPF